MCINKILSQKGQTIISNCIGCKTFYIWHDNLMLSFSEEAFSSFKEVLNSLSFEDRCLPFPGGEERIILHTPHDDISFAFAEEEFELCKAAIDEAIFMKEVYELMQ
jgi:hypothetical protein